MSNEHTSEDPYSVLGVPEDATQSQIKQAYRKLALRHHPDKQTSPAAKEEAHSKFAQISQAYEILGDDSRRREYDATQAQPQQQQDWAHHRRAGFAFHDPFAVFEQVFAQEFAHMNQQRPPRQHMDPFFSTSMGFGNVFGRDPFGDFFQGGGMDPFSHQSMFGGGGGMDPFAAMQQRMQQSQMEMMRQQQQQQQQQFGGGGMFGGFGSGGGMQSQSYSYSSSSSFGGGGTRESISTTTRIIDGRRQTVTERTITKPDGTVERHVETVGDDPRLQQGADYPQIDSGRGRREY